MKLLRHITPIFLPLLITSIQYLHAFQVLMIIGGRHYSTSSQNFKELSSVEVVGPSSSCSVAPLPEARHGHNAAVLEDEVVVCGGLSGLHLHERRTCFTYDWRRERWGRLEPKAPRGAAFSSMVSLGEGFYIMGGRQMLYKTSQDRPWQRTTRVLHYNKGLEHQHNWRYVGNLSEPVSDGCAAMLEGKLWLVGGPGVVSVLEPGEEKWRVGVAKTVNTLVVPAVREARKEKMSQAMLDKLEMEWAARGKKIMGKGQRYWDRSEYRDMWQPTQSPWPEDAWDWRGSGATIPPWIKSIQGVTKPPRVYGGDWKWDQTTVVPWEQGWPSRMKRGALEDLRNMGSGLAEYMSGVSSEMGLTWRSETKTEKPNVRLPRKWQRPVDVPVVPVVQDWSQTWLQTTRKPKAWQKPTRIPGKQDWLGRGEQPGGSMGALEELKKIGTGVSQYMRRLPPGVSRKEVARMDQLRKLKQKLEFEQQPRVFHVGDEILDQGIIPGLKVTERGDDLVSDNPILEDKTLVMGRAEMQGERVGLSCHPTVLNSESGLVMVGGYSGFNGTGRQSFWLPTSRPGRYEWEQLGDMGEARRRGPALGSVMGRLVVAGGGDWGTNTVEVLEGRNWRKMNFKMRERREHAAYVTVDSQWFPKCHF